MRCSYCKKDVDEKDLYCSNCGKEIIKKKNYKPIFIVGCFLFVIITLFTMMFVSMFHYFNTYETEPASVKDFIQSAEKLDCEIIDVLDMYPNHDVEFYYVTNQETCPYLMSYTKFKNEELMYNFYSNLLKDTKNIEGQFRSESNVNILHYMENTTIGKEYKAAALSKKTVLYINTEKVNKDTANEIKESLGFHFEMDWTFVYFGVASFGLEILLMIISLWKIFKKIGRKGWIALVPIYNIILLCKDVLGKKRYALLFFIPVVNFVFLLVLAFHIAKVFGKNEGYQVLTIFFSSFMIPFIAFDDSKYTKPGEIKKTEKINYKKTIIEEKKDNNENNIVQTEIKNDEVLIAKVSDINKTNFSNKEEFIQVSNNHVILKVIWNIICWFITGFCLFLVLGSILLVVEDHDYAYIIIGCVMLSFAFVACPIISKYMKKYEVYTKYKPLIVFILILLFFIAAMFAE